MKRLFREFKEIIGTPDPKIQLFPKDENNLKEWKGVIIGPTDTPFRDYSLEIEIHICEDYPIKPPVVKFKTKVFHPNVDLKTGEICTSLLKDDWSPAYTLKTICIALQSLLSNPEPNSPLNCDAANIVRLGDNLAYSEVARYFLSQPILEE